MSHRLISFLSGANVESVKKILCFQKFSEWTDEWSKRVNTIRMTSAFQNFPAFLEIMLANLFANWLHNNSFDRREPQIGIDKQAIEKANWFN